MFTVGQISHDKCFSYNKITHHEIEVTALGLHELCSAALEAVELRTPGERPCCPLASAVLSTADDCTWEGFPVSAASRVINNSDFTAGPTDRFALLR